MVPHGQQHGEAEPPSTATGSFSAPPPKTGKKKWRCTASLTEFHGSAFTTVRLAPDQAWGEVKVFYKPGETTHDHIKWVLREVQNSPVQLLRLQDASSGNAIDRETLVQPGSVLNLTPNVTWMPQP